MWQSANPGTAIAADRSYLGGYASQFAPRLIQTLRSEPGSLDIPRALPRNPEAGTPSLGLHSRFRAFGENTDRRTQ